MTETKQKSSLISKWNETHRLEGDIVLRHENRFGKGMPDISITAFGYTSWFEGKVWTGSKRSATSRDLRSPQHLKMRKFERVGVAYYIIWREVEDDTIIIEPTYLGDIRAKHVPEAVYIVVPYTAPSRVVSVMRRILEVRAPRLGTPEYMMSVRRWMVRQGYSEGVTML